MIRVYSLPSNQKQNYFIIFIVLKLFHYCTLSPFFTVLVVNLLMAFLAASPRRRYEKYKEKQIWSAILLDNILYFKTYKYMSLIPYTSLSTSLHMRALKKANEKLEKLAVFPLDSVYWLNN